MDCFCPVGDGAAGNFQSPCGGRHGYVHRRHCCFDFTTLGVLPTRDLPSRSLPIINRVTLSSAGFERHAVRAAIPLHQRPGVQVAGGTCQQPTAQSANGADFSADLVIAVAARIFVAAWESAGSGWHRKNARNSETACVAVAEISGKPLRSLKRKHRSVLARLKLDIVSAYCFSGTTWVNR